MAAKEMLNLAVSIAAFVLTVYSLYLNAKGRHAEAIYNLVFAIWVATEICHD